MNFTRHAHRVCQAAILALSAAIFYGGAFAQEDQPVETAAPPAKKSKPAAQKQESTPKPPSPEQELQAAIDSANNDRAALLRNLEAYLQKYPDSPKRPQIYRALVEASLQLRDDARAAGYAERIVALAPADISITLLAIQLLERTGDEPALRRARNYSGRVLEFVEKSAASERSPHVSLEEWEQQRGRDRMSVLLLRGRLSMKLKDHASAQKDFEKSYALVANSGAAEKLGEIAELNKDLNRAIVEYARAFALAETSSGETSRREIRRKLGNVWRLAHGSEDGLGEYLLRTFDEVAAAAAPKQKRNAAVREPFDFVLRSAPGGSPFPLADRKGEIVVVDFWTTWCGPCRLLEPRFERVAAQFAAEKDVLFLEANCDEDETLVAPYLEETKPKANIVFADGIAQLFAVNSFPTVVVIDRGGKIAYRAEGFSEETFEQDLTAAVNRAISAAAAHN